MGPGNCAQGFDDGPRIGRAYPQILCNGQVGALERLEHESVPALLIRVAVQAFKLLPHPGIEPLHRRGPGHKPSLLPCPPPGTGKSVPESADQIPVIGKHRISPRPLVNIGGKNREGRHNLHGPPVLHWIHVLQGQQSSECLRSPLGGERCAFRGRLALDAQKPLTRGVQGFLCCFGCGDRI